MVVIRNPKSSMPVKYTEVKRLFSAAFQQTRSYSAPADRSIPAAKQKYVPISGTYPKGFLAGTAHAGVKASNTKYDDVTMVVSETPCNAVGVFTRNIFKAAPVQTSKAILDNRQNQNIRGVIVNSGCANAVTGTLGKEHATAMAETTDKCFDGPTDHLGLQTLVMSTGVIGQRLPIDRITQAIPKAHQGLGSSHDHWIKAAQAICTTDTFPKLVSRSFYLPSQPETQYSITGFTKGAGMICPNMATLLAIICTDVKMDPSTMHRFLTRANAVSFNSITIDGDTSTNDTVALLANGAAAPDGTPALTLPIDENRKIVRHLVSEDARTFQAVLSDFMTDLAKLVVRDGEGATKFVTIRVTSDVSRMTAKRAAISIAKSSLVKTALYGKDANWGRILCAVGYSPGIIKSDTVHAQTRDKISGRYQVEPERTSVSFIPSDGGAELKLLVRGEPEEVDEARAKEILEMEDLEILVSLCDGPGKEPPRSQNDWGVRTERGSQIHEVKVYTCDFSHEYVTINGDYRT